MPVGRFFYATTLQVGDKILLQGEEFKHLSVLRPSPSQKIELVNGQGELAQASVTSITRKEAHIEILSLHDEPTPSFRLILAQALPRMPRLDFIVEKGTELGMTDLWLFPGERSEKKSLSEHEKARVHHLLIAAMKQCGRLHLPVVEYKSPLCDWTDLPYPGFFGHTAPSAPPFEKAWKSVSPLNRALLVVGPEKGFSSEEVDHLQKISFQGVRLHPNILRTDTAACSMLALASHFHYYS